jgi:hypothetical protein
MSKFEGTYFGYRTHTLWKRVDIQLSTPQLQHNDLHVPFFFPWRETSRVTG